MSMQDIDMNGKIFAISLNHYTCVYFHSNTSDGGNVQTVFFQYWYINLIFIYFSKRAGDSYWSGVLVRRCVVHFYVIYKEFHQQNNILFFAKEAYDCMKVW